MDMDPTAALSATPTKEATHLSMTACHDLTKGVFHSCHVSVSSSTVVGDSVMTGGSATALSATYAKETTHLSMTTGHDLYGVFVGCHVSVSSSTVPAHTSPDSNLVLRERDRWDTKTLLWT